MEYKHLNLSDFETRFLRILEPSPSKKSLVRAEIVTESLTKAPKYSALSYTWGEDRTTARIEIDGRNVPVTKNVAAALKELDLPKGYLIWIDAICINQNDLYEKSYQVGIMGEIFQRATTVIAWLGEANADTERATSLLNEVGEVLRRKPKGSSNRPGFEKRCLTSAIRTSSDPSGALRGLLDLLNRPFWERVWIIQEVAKAKRVIVRCGRFQTTLEPIWKVFEHVPSIDRKAKDLLNAIKGFRSSQQNVRAEGITLLEALLMTKRSRATEPRDRVFALLSLTTDGRELVPLPDYNRPLESVFHEISVGMLARKRQLAVILLACRTAISWQSMLVDFNSRLAVQWTDLHECVPQWIINAVLQPEKTQPRTLQVQEKQIKVAATYVGKIVDCESSSVEADPESSKEEDENSRESRSSKISDTIEAYMSDILHICQELNPGVWGEVDVDKYKVEGFAHQLRDYRTKARQDIQEGIEANNMLLSAFQRLGPLRFRDRKLWSLAALHDRELHRRRSHSSRRGSNVSSASHSVASLSIEEASSWEKVEAQLEEESVFGMQFGVLEREIPVNGGPPSLTATVPGQVYSGVGFLCKEAQPDDKIWSLPGLRHPVILRPTTNQRYRLVGDCILRTRAFPRKAPTTDIYIETKN